MKEREKYLFDLNGYLVVENVLTLKFLSLLPSMNGYFFLDYYVLLYNTCLYRPVNRHGHHCHSSPLAEVRIPRRTAAPDNGADCPIMSLGCSQMGKGEVFS